MIDADKHVSREFASAVLKALPGGGSDGHGWYIVDVTQGTADNPAAIVITYESHGGYVSSRVSATERVFLKSTRVVVTVAGEATEFDPETRQW